jgi:hypothetical protein
VDAAAQREHGHVAAVAVQQRARVARRARDGHVRDLAVLEELRPLDAVERLGQAAAQHDADRRAPEARGHRVGGLGQLLVVSAQRVAPETAPGLPIIHPACLAVAPLAWL